MSIEGELRQIAGQIAARAQGHAAHLIREYQEAQLQAANLKAKLDSANLALDRFSNFEVKIGTDYQCPTCWIDKGLRTPLRALPSDTRNDIFGCKYGHDLEIPH